jgi:hypothetical protein
VSDMSNQNIEEVLPQEDGSVLVRIRPDTRAQAVRALNGEYGGEIITVADEALAGLLDTAVTEPAMSFSDRETTADTLIDIVVAERILDYLEDQQWPVVSVIRRGVDSLITRARLLDRENQDLRGRLDTAANKANRYTEALHLCDAAIQTLSERLGVITPLAEDGKRTELLVDELETEIRNGPNGSRRLSNARRRAKDKAEAIGQPPVLEGDPEPPPSP